MTSPPENFGLDFGTSTSFIGRFVNPQTELLGSGVDGFIPSLVRKTQDTVLCGFETKGRVDGRYFRSLKKWIGRERQDVCVEGCDSIIDCAHERVTAEEVDDLIVLLLEHIVSDAEQNSGVNLRARGAVKMGCPAMWNTSQRERLSLIAQRVGLDVDAKSLIDEAVAAGLVWVTARQSDVKTNGKILVIDMGGGTLDIAVLSIASEITESSSVPEIVVQSSTGNAIAGDYLDIKIAGALRSKLDDMGFDLKDLGNQLIDLAEMAKKKLSKVETWNLGAEAKLQPGYDAFADANVSLSQAELNRYLRPVVDAAFAEVESALRLAMISESISFSDEIPVPVNAQSGNLGGVVKKKHLWKQRIKLEEAMCVDPADLYRDLDFVVLAGGMSHLPQIQHELRARLEQAENYFAKIFYGTTEIREEEDSDTLVVKGLASPKKMSNLNFLRPNYDIVARRICTDDTHGIAPERILANAGFNVGSASQLEKDDQRYRSNSNNLEGTCDCRRVEVVCVAAGGNLLGMQLVDLLVDQGTINSSLVGKPPVDPEVIFSIPLLSYFQTGVSIKHNGDGTFFAGPPNGPLLYRIATSQVDLEASKFWKENPCVKKTVWRVVDNGNEIGQK
jgi:molecular chaperone DnaK (HSP70)